MKVFLFSFLMTTQGLHAQLAYNYAPAKRALYSAETEVNDYQSFLAGRKLYQRNTGVIIGLQKGKYTSIELGGEAHWRKISLTKPRVVGATANMEYNYEKNVIGYKAGMWMKRGRINLTYGANVSYFTNFDDGHRFGIGPSIGFRLLGFHMVNGYTFLTKDNSENPENRVDVNPLYLSLRYYIPVHNSFTWDRKTMKKKHERQRERAKRKKEKEKKKKNEESGSFWNMFKKNNKDTKTKQ
jgi:hypothetical protein